MKSLFRMSIVAIIATVVLGTVAFRDVSAQTVLNEEQLNKISSNCVSIKNTLHQLHASDALLRVNRGQVYEAVGTKLMSTFNSRLLSNNQDARGLQAITTNYQAALAAFRTDYQAYERQLSAAIKVDCEKQPAEFHASIEDARSKRAKVHEDVLRLHQNIDDYRSGVNDFLLNFERTND